MTPRHLRTLLWPLILGMLVASCGGGGGGSTSAPVVTPDPPTTGVTDPSLAFQTRNSTARFLTQATFGPTPNDVDQLVGTSPSAWLRAEFAKAPTLHLPIIEEYQQSIDPATSMNFINANTSSFAFWRNAIEANDQLRQRVVFALSEIIVASSIGTDLLSEYPEAIGYYQDILTQNAFGNYRDLLEEITYSPAMGEYLTYEGNQKANPMTGRMPDENYAREIMQLFTIGLVELNTDGTVVLGADGEPVETYDNDDITGLAKVFTGLLFDYSLLNGDDFSDLAKSPLVIDEDRHSPEEKAFLGTVIPANTLTADSIDLALDEIMAHPNVAPFVGRQLIQRLVTSHPEPDYVSRVSTAFNTGTYVLPDGEQVGDGRKGDLQATVAAILFDPDARENAPVTANRFGKPREPILRFVAWARAFEVTNVRPELVGILYDTSPSSALGQHPYRSRSVFNFFRPGYVAPGTETGALNLTIPELQIVNASSVPGYANFISYFAFDLQEEVDVTQLQSVFDQDGVQISAAGAQGAMRPDYSTVRSLADDPAALADHLDELLTFGGMSDETRDSIIDILGTLPSTDEFIDLRAKVAIFMVMTSPDFLVQK